MDTDAKLSNSGWKRVKYYTQLAIKRFESGVESVKELLSTLTIDERWGVMLKFEDFEPEKFAEMVADAPQWTEWMGGFAIRLDHLTVNSYKHHLSADDTEQSWRSRKLW